jgi:hypothetical protein
MVLFECCSLGWWEDIVVKNPVKRGDAPLAKAKQKPPWTLKNYTASGEESVLTIPIKRL